MEIPAIAGVKKGSNVQLAKATGLAPSVVAIAVSIIIAFFIVLPRFREVLRLKDDNVQLKSRSAKLEEKAQILDSLVVSDLELQLASANQLIPSDKGVFTLLSSVERTAGSSGVLLDRVEVSPGSLNKEDSKTAAGVAQPVSGTGAQSTAKSAASLIPKTQLKISISSDYKSFLLFLSRMYSSPRVVSVVDLTMASASSGGTGQINSSLLLDSYWQPTPTELASIETPLVELTPDELSRLEKVEISPAEGIPSIPDVPKGRTDLFAPF